MIGKPTNIIQEEILIFDKNNIIYNYLFSKYKKLPFTNITVCRNIESIKKELRDKKYSAVVLHIDDEATKSELFDEVRFIRAGNNFVTLLAVSFQEELLLDQRVIDLGIDDIFILPMSPSCFIFRMLMIISKSKRCSGVNNINSNNFVKYKKEIENIKNKLEMFV